jgi:predicted nucleic acid-binding protein
VSGTTLVDSNVILDVVTDDAAWSARSRRALERAADEGGLAINPSVYAEVSVGYDRIEDLDAALPPETFARLPLPWAAGFLAGECFVRYRRAGGTRRSPLPDFYIGAHAAIEGLTLLTRDARRYRTYLPRLSVITP